MIGSIDPNRKKSVVVGGGISGLLSAYYLMKAGYQVRLIEKTPRLGGLVHTAQTPFGIAESSVHSLLVNDAVRALFSELGVDLIGLSPQSRGRFIWRDARKRSIPLNFFEFLSLIWRLFFKRAKSKSFANLKEWGEYFLGETATAYLLNPFLRGIYAATPQKLAPLAVSKSLEVPEGRTLFSVLQKLRSFKKNNLGERTTMMTAKGGMGTLVTALVRELKAKPEQVTIELGREFQTRDLVALKDSNVIFTVPAYAAERVTGLRLGVRYNPIVSVTAFFREDAFVKTPPRGVGVLIPECESDVQILGILFNSSSFEKRVSLSVGKSPLVSFTVMLGGAVGTKAIEQTDEEVIAIVTAECARIVGTMGAPVHCQIFRWPLGIPQYDQAILNLPAKISQQMGQTPLKPGLVFFGNYTGEISLRGMIQDAQKLG